jgi:hypothetical protein
MTDLDGELEKLRAEARHRLEGERELDEKLAGYERERIERELRMPPEPAPAAAAADEESDARDDEAPAKAEAAKPESTKPSVTAGLTAAAAERGAKEAATKVSSLSTPKLVGYAIAFIFAAWIVDRLIGPIVAIVVLGILAILGYRLLRWMGAPDDDEDDRNTE